MANVSFYISNAADLHLGNVGTGTNAPGSGDLEIRINHSNVLTRKEAYKLIKEILNYINYGDQSVFKP
jgi:hypothetical protein